ncbi:MAG TPA: hypothetical protein DC064_26110 [Cyanobacteria bacterium UBA9273]|nr:hypothetical protein [Cyanobacteria bacterium UBA9273]
MVIGQNFKPITHHPLPITHHPSPITHHPSPITHHHDLFLTPRVALGNSIGLPFPEDGVETWAWVAFDH